MMNNPVDIADIIGPLKQCPEQPLRLTSGEENHLVNVDSDVTLINLTINRLSLT